MPKKLLPNVSRAEGEILALLWEKGKGTVKEIWDVLPPERDIGYATVQTLLRRLEKKGYIRHENRGLTHVFFSVVKREDVIERSVGDFVNCLFGGDPVPLMVHLAEHSKVSSDDIERLKKLVRKTKKQSTEVGDE